MCVSNGSEHPANALWRSQDTRTKRTKISGRAGTQRRSGWRTEECTAGRTSSTGGGRSVVGRVAGGIAGGTS